MTLIFDEASLVKSLSRLDAREKHAFAAACATRQLLCFETFSTAFNAADAERMRMYVGLLWEAIGEESFLEDYWQHALEQVMDLSPEENVPWTPLHAYAEDAIASLSYSIRCLVSNSAQEAAWAARRAYEAADQAAIHAIEITPGPDSEARILAHKIVQRELERQERDVRLLQAGGGGAIKTIQSRAYEEQLLDESELQIPDQR